MERRSERKVMFAGLGFIACLAAGWQCACAGELPATTGTPSESATVRESQPGYRTPLAGEPFHTVFLGETVDIPRRDRGNQMALSLGGTFYLPKDGNDIGIPLIALYLLHTREDYRLRLTASGVVNELEAARPVGHIEFLGRFENNTIPTGKTELIDNHEIKQTSVEWGTLSAGLGIGVRYPVAPFEVDNDLRLQLFGQTGYFYAKPTGDTPFTVRLPPDTMLYGLNLRGRYDGLRRNQLELLHLGVAWGFDLDFGHRDKWGDAGNDLITVKGSDTRNFLRLSGYALGAFGLPGLSEKNRMVVSVYGGMMGKTRTDRYNAFQFDGGPFPTEAADIARLHYPGIGPNETLAADYLMTNLEYRREILFFLYLYLRGTLIWAERSTVTALNQVGFKSNSSQAIAAGMTLGFMWDSQLDLEYSWDSGFIRNGRSGSSILFMWNKSI